MPTTRLNDLEQEIVILFAVWDMLFGLVNRSIFFTDFLDKGEVRFNGDEHETLFAILLVDFLSLPTDGLFNLHAPSTNMKADRNYLFYLRRCTESPELGTNVSTLKKVTDDFVDWLAEEIVVQNIWLPSVDIQVSLKAERVVILKLCGNAAKHGFARLSADIGKTQKLLEEHGHALAEGKSIIAHRELSNWLLNDGPLNYMAPVAAEHLNNLRWALYEYLRPVFDEHAYLFDGKHYAYRYPSGLNTLIVKEFYWELMNSVIHEPYFPRFKIAQNLRNIM